MSNSLIPAINLGKGSMRSALAQGGSQAIVTASLATAWGFVLWLLWPEWDLNAQYEYGKVVPLLAGYLFLDRWRSRPAREFLHRERTFVSPTVSDSVKRRRRSSALLGSVAGAVVCGGVTGLALFLHGANPEWRLLGSLASLAAIGLSLLLLYQAGGTRWLRHFGFPLFLFWLAVPLPRPWEISTMDYLMRANAALATELVRWAGVEALATANVIRLPDCAVGVDEACSGIRSLNGSMMMAVFLGEWFTLHLARRLWLVLAAVVLALATNLGRTVLLIYVANTQGPEAMERWHDPAGLSVLAICIAAIMAAGWLLKLTTPHAAAVKRLSPATRRTAEAGATSLPPRRILLRQASVAGAFSMTLLLCLLGVWLRYGDAAPAPLPSASAWSVKFPHSAASYEDLPVSRMLQSLLRFDQGRSARWVDGPGRLWMGFYFEWSAGRSSHQDVMLHDPTVCLGGLGMTLQRDLGVVETEPARGIRLPVHGYRFDDQGQTVHVFNLLVEESMEGISQEQGALTWAKRWQAAVEGRRSGTKRRLITAVWGVDVDHEAQEAFHEFLRQGWHEWRATASASTPP